MKSTAMHEPKRSFLARRLTNFRCVGGVLAPTGALAGVGGALITAQAPASAWSWSSQVTLTGNVKTIYHPGIQSVYVTGSDGERGWATLSNVSTYGASYYFKFNNVGGGSGIHVNWTVYTRSGSFANGFGVARPSTGANAVRDLCDFGPGC